MATREHVDSTDAQYAKLRQDVLDGTFPPGTVLLETVLSRDHGVSRTPVREALGRLAQDGLIERSSRGFQVKTRKPDEILEIYEARIVLEATSASLAATRRSEFDLARLTHLAERRREACDPSLFGQLNSDWHEALRDAAHNATISDLLARLDSLLLIYRPRNLSGAADQSVEEHDLILAAVRDGDPEAAHTAMRDHLRRMRDLRVDALVNGG